MRFYTQEAEAIAEQIEELYNKISNSPVEEFEPTTGTQLNGWYVLQNAMEIISEPLKEYKKRIDYVLDCME